MELCDKYLTYNIYRRNAHLGSKDIKISEILLIRSLKLADEEMMASAWAWEKYLKENPIS